MRKIIGTIGATLAIVVVMATSASPASFADRVRSTHSGGANFGLADGSVRFVADSVALTDSVALLPYIEQENLYRLSGESGAAAMYHI